MPSWLAWHATGILIWSKFRARQWPLNFGGLLKNLLAVYHLPCCGGGRGDRQQCRLEIWVQTVLYSKCNYKRQWNFPGDGSAAHTDYRDWHSKFLFLWQMTTVKKALHLLTVLQNRKAEWERKPLIPWMKQTNETHIKQVLHMVLTRNWDSELYELRNATILFSRITKYIY